MSDNSASHSGGKIHKDDNTSNEKKGNVESSSSGILKALFIGLVFIIIFACIFFPKGKNSDTKEEDNKQTVNNTEKVTQPSEQIYTPPPHDPITVSITDSLSDLVPVPTCYYLAFACNQPYRVVNGAGESFDGEANQDVSIGNVTGTNKNLNLRFCTRNGSKTVMTVYLIPKPLKIN